MRVSIVVPTYNGIEFLGSTIESVRSQTLREWELVVVDDGSADGSAAVAEAYAERDGRIRVVVQANQGVASARNRGLQESTRSSEYVIFLDHDDIWEKGALELLVRALDDQPRAVATNGLSRFIDAQGDLCAPGHVEAWGRQRRGVEGGRLVPWRLNRPTTLAVLAFDNRIATPGQVLIRRSALEAVGSFDPAVAPCDDWDLWLRLSQRGEIVFLDRVVLNWRIHSGNRSWDLDGLLQAQTCVRRKLLASVALSADQRSTVALADWYWSREVRRRRLVRARELLQQGELRPAARQLGRVLLSYLDCARGVPARAALFRPTTVELFRAARATPSDINEHLDTLYRLARRCRNVTEFGTRNGVSTAALLRARPRTLVTYDRDRWPAVDTLLAAATETGCTGFTFRQVDVLDVEIEETDMLFIDTWHVYEQLKQELALHAAKVRKYLVFHDTTTFGEQGETPGHRGIWPAIAEFLQSNPHWTLVARYTHCNGLTILKRSSLPARQPSERIPAGSYARPASGNVTTR